MACVVHGMFELPPTFGGGRRSIGPGTQASKAQFVGQAGVLIRTTSHALPLRAPRGIIRHLPLPVARD